MPHRRHPSPPKPVQLYAYQKLQQCYHIDCGGNSACLRQQRAPLQQEQWQAELWSRCNVSGEQVKVPLSEWCIITIMCSTNIQHYAGWLLHNGNALHEWLPAGLLLCLSSTGWVARFQPCTSTLTANVCWHCNCKLPISIVVPFSKTPKHSSLKIWAVKWKGWFCPLQTQGPFVLFVLERELIPHRHVAESVSADNWLLQPRCIQPTVWYAGPVSEYTNIPTYSDFAVLQKLSRNY